MQIGTWEVQVVYFFSAVLAFFWGASIGSFLNVCIYRIPLELSLILPRSHCPRCRQTIAWYDNIPILSFFLRRAKCRHCGAEISVRYPLVELLTAVLFLVVMLKLDWGTGGRPLGLSPVSNVWIIPIYWLCVGGLILGSFVDFEHMIIPDRVSIGGVIAGLALSAAVPALHGQESHMMGFLTALLGTIIGGGILWSIACLGTLMFKREAMGMGDVKLLAAIGAFLGWRCVIFSLLVSSFLGAGVGLTLVAMKKSEMKGRIPYGPYLALAALVWMLWGPSIWGWYTNFFMYVE